jgi:hypothetical protein
VAVSFIGGGNRGYLEKTIDLLQETDEIYQVHLAMSGVQIHKVSGDRH